MNTDHSDVAMSNTQGSDVREALADDAKRLADEYADASAADARHYAPGRKAAARVNLFVAIDDLSHPAPPHPATTAVGWLPIETAPKDGRKLILFYLNRNGKARTVMARWVTDEEAAETDADDVGLEGGWYECIDNWDDYCQITIHEGDPTHWMPLPTPPAITNTGGTE